MPVGAWYPPEPGCEVGWTFPDGVQVDVCPVSAELACTVVHYSAEDTFSTCVEVVPEPPSAGLAIVALGAILVLRRLRG